MALPPIEESPVVLLRWTTKALDEPEIIAKIRKEMMNNKLLLLPTLAHDNVLLTTTQDALESQAESDHLVMRRRVVGPSAVEVVMDHFQKRHRSEFCVSDPASDRASSLDPEGLFSVHERCLLVLGLLERINFSDETLIHALCGQSTRETRINLRYVLQSHGWIDVLTPLHVDAQKAKVEKITWYPLWRMNPPIDAIEDYYGPSIAFYFAFMGLLGSWLFSLGILGLSAFLFRVYRNDTIDEDEYTPFYGLICFLWAVLFVRFWERKEFEIAYNWGTLDLTNGVDEFEQDFTVGGDSGGLYAHRRPEFRGSWRTSPITGELELYFAPYRRKIQYLFSAMVTILMLGVAFFVMILSLNLQGYIQPKSEFHPFYFRRFADLSQEGAWFDAQSSWKCYIPVILHVVSILTLNTIYRGVARKLTHLENHETQTSYENSLVLKRFLFEAFDCYIVLFYLAFYERDVDRLRIELVAVFNIDSFRRLGTELILPYILHYRDPKGDSEHPHDLHLDEYEQFDDYMEILIQFGYVTLFASAYPLASLVMAGAVWTEIRSDISKLTYFCQKPMAGERIHNIGIWKLILQFMVWFSCLTNCLLFGFTSDQMMQYMPHFYIRDDEGATHMVHDKGWLAILIIFGLERALLYFGLTLHAMIPKISESLTITLKRRKYLLARQSKKTN